MNLELKEHVAGLLAGVDNIEAVLLLLKGQYAVLYPETGVGTRTVSFKLVSPTAVRAAFGQIAVDSGWLPSEVRRWGQTPAGEYAIMFVPAQRQVVPLTNTWGDRFPMRRIKVEVPLPPLVFAGCGTNYWVWACAEAPHPKARLYEAPLPNVNQGGSICFGSNHPPEVRPETMGQAWKVFMTSPFNNHLIGGSSRQYPKDVREQLLALAASGAAAYPTADLVPLNNVVDDIARKLADRRWDA
jgi:PRTRC genetic system protein B